MCTMIDIWFINMFRLQTLYAVIELLIIVLLPEYNPLTILMDWYYRVQFVLCSGPIMLNSYCSPNASYFCLQNVTRLEQFIEYLRAYSTRTYARLCTVNETHYIPNKCDIVCCQLCHTCIYDTAKVATKYES